MTYFLLVEKETKMRELNSFELNQVSGGWGLGIIYNLPTYGDF